VISAYLDAGFDHVYTGQIGLDQEGFFVFYALEIRHRLEGCPDRRGPTRSEVAERWLVKRRG
jgi:hypothetical protein